MRAHRLFTLATWTAFAFSYIASPVHSADWARFRGPNGTGVSVESQTVPAEWSAEKNVKWKVPLPGMGSSSPIVVGSRIYVTCWNGYGMDRNDPGDQKNLRRHLVCLDLATGATIWSQEVEPTLPEDEYGGMFAEHGYASHTPVSDGERIYVYFGKTGALAFDLEGKKLWQTPIGTESDPRGWGSASSPVLYKNLLIVTAPAESEAMVAINKLTGEVVWKKEASGFGGTWGTPVLVEIDANRTDLVLGVPGEIWAFDPETGKLRWYSEAIGGDSFCSSVVTDGQTVYAIEGRGGGSIAVRAGGEGDISKTNTVWSGRHNNRIGTPVVHDGLIYFFGNRMANCVDAKTGESVYRERLPDVASAASPQPPAEQPANSDNNESQGGERRRGRGGRGGGMGGQDYSSPIIADGKVIYVSRTGTAYVLAVGREYKVLAVNRVTETPEDFSATPAISNGNLLIRSSKHLYCVAQ